MLYVLTRTSKRPRYFAALRANLAVQGVPFVHVVHSDEPTDAYVAGDIVVRSDRLPPGKVNFTPELYQARLLEALRGQPPGWVVFIDDDDRYLPGALQRIREACTDPGVMPVWRVMRERGRVSPAQPGADPRSEAGKLCWEAAAFHTSHLDAATAAVTAARDADGRFWAALAARLRVEHHDFTATEPQSWFGKGHWRRFDKPLLTVAVPVLGRSDRVREVQRRFHDPRVEVLFLPDETDHATVEALRRERLWHSFAPPAAEWGCPTYASKINHAYRVTDAPLLLYASDDVTPQAGWLDAALKHLEDETVGLLGTNDARHHLVRRGLLATHGIIRRAYVQEHGSASLPGSGPVMSEAYRHWCCDVEVTAVARARARYRYASNVILRHAPGRDATHDLGRSYAAVDRATRAQRIPTWPTLEGFAA